MQWRLGLDLGTNSIGWAAIRLNGDMHPDQLLDMGVRIFPDGREPSKQGRVGDSLAVERRMARGMRRNRDRRLKRMQRLIDQLVEFGLFPEDQDDRKKLESLNPYELRSKAVEEALPPHELGRAIYHLAKRRGFKSNRKADSDEDSEFYGKISALRKEMGTDTLGQFLWRRVQNGEAVRFRGEDGDFYPDRQMYSDELSRIRQTQQPHHGLTDTQWDALHDTIFFQRDLIPVERGRCRFYTQHPRAWAGLPIAQEFRIIQEINNLEWIDENLRSHNLNEEQRTALYDRLHKNLTLGWNTIRKMKGPDGRLLFPKDCLFNYEKGGRKKFEGNKTDIALGKIMGPVWERMDTQARNDLVEFLYKAKTNTEVLDKAGELGLDAEQSKALAKFSLPQRTMAVSREFMEDIVPIMLETGQRYFEAITKLTNEYGQPLHHSMLEDGEIIIPLPYYGEVLEGATLGAHPEADEHANPEHKYGRINNPTVHIALNQLRKLVNTLIERFGPPDQIHVELSRDLKKPRSERDEITRKNNAHERENKQRAKIFQEIFPGVEPGALDLKKIRLWEELGEDKLARTCVYTGKTISAAMLFNGEAEIEHILPFSRTLDNSAANLTVSLRQANRVKGNDTPYAARSRFETQGWRWEDILSRAERLPGNKSWRFGPDALDRYEGETDFIARQLTDNAYISKLTRRYLAKVCGPNNIVVSPGRLTALLRGKWRLNGLLGDDNFVKQRDDHRHHALDAAVIACTDRSILKKVSTLSGRGADDFYRVEVPECPLDRDAICNTLDGIVVSFKPDHGTQGKFFKDQAHGPVKRERRDKSLPNHNLVRRKPIETLSSDEILTIRDKAIRTDIMAFLDEQYGGMSKLDANGLSKALYRFGYEIWPEMPVKGKSKKSPDMRPPLKSLRILISNKSVKEIAPPDAPHEPYKAYVTDSYVCCDIYELPKGKQGKWSKNEKIWLGEFRTQLDMRNPPDDMNARKPHPAAKHIARLFKNDMVEIQEGSQPVYMRVAGFKSDGRIDLRPHTQATQKRNRLSINTWRKKGLKKVHVAPDGTIRRRKTG